jgi:hypothetical protein
LASSPLAWRLPSWHKGAACQHDCGAADLFPPVNVCTLQERVPPVLAAVQACRPGVSWRVFG